MMLQRSEVKAIDAPPRRPGAAPVSDKTVQSDTGRAHTVENGT